MFGAFSLDAGLGWLKSELGKFYAVDPRVPSFGACDPETGPASASCINLEGHEQTYAPDFTFNIGMQYVFGQGSDNRIHAAHQLRPRRPSSGRRCSRTKRAATASRRATS